MDSSNSSGDSSSDYSTDSSDDDGMETAQINGVKIQLPEGLCERRDIFKEFFSTGLWNSFSDLEKQHLQTFLPNFPKNDEKEKSKTLQRLFNFEPFRFNSPIEKFYEDLKAGYFRPDIAHMRKVIRKAQKKESKCRYKSYKEKLKQEVLESQQRLLYQIRNLPPGCEPKAEKRKLPIDYTPHRTKRKYFQVLSQIKSQVQDPNEISSDENYPEGPPSSLSRKQKRHLNSVKNSLNASSERVFQNTTSNKINVALDLDRYLAPSHNPFYVNEESYRNLLTQHRKQVVDRVNNQEINTNGITIQDVINRTQLPFIKSPVPHSHTSKHHNEHRSSSSRKKIKKEPIVPKTSEYLFPKKTLSFGHSSESDSDSIIDTLSFNSSKLLKETKEPAKPSTPPPVNPVKTEIKEEFLDVFQPILDTSLEESPILPPSMTPINSFSQYGKITPIKLEDLDGIDMMNLPIDLDNSDIDILSELTCKPELMQDTHANFFSLIRDVICSTTEHRMNMYTLQERLKNWQDNPISPLNDWYSLTDNWIGLLPSAITFLCGNSSEQPDDFVPYMEYKTQVDVYQWIGAGRDSDNLLTNLCQFWLDHRTEGKCSSPYNKDEYDLEVADRTSSPPPPRCVTNWSVRKATPEEIREFQEQERRRYDTPHKAFTFRCNGYESIVGPLKGMYNPSVTSAKARGHTMLNADRPNFVTILSLVRDATARLPNGEGTRADICELLKSSQYISSNAPDNVLQSVVSGALDRMHTQHDPCVKYDPKRKIWIYLHRHRTEEDFERLHQQSQGVSRSRKANVKKSPAKPKPKIEKIVKPSAKVETPTSPIVPVEKAKPIRRTSIQTKPAAAALSTAPALVPVSSQKNSSLLLTNHNSKPETSQQPFPPPPVFEQPKTSQAPSPVPSAKLASKPEDNEAVQAIVQNRSTANLMKSGKSVVKILSPSQGKSIIIPTSNPQIIKQIQEHNTTGKPLNQQVITQQLLQSLAAQQNKIASQKIEEQPQKIKVPVSVQQQIIQSINPQQLQNIKNVTLLRAPNPNTTTPNTQPQSNIVTVSVAKNTTQANSMYGPGIQIKTHGNLTQSQQQQILQTIRHKILPQANLIPQPVIYKQKGGKNVTAATSTTSTNPPKLETTNKVNTSQSPMVAKVLTNAAGQVISVESLLAHQKQHGSLPQGTTLRVAGGKVGPQNIIHLANPSKSNTITQYAVGTQNNLIALTTQPKLIVASPNTTTTSTVSNAKPNPSRPASKPQTFTKFSSKVAQQLINAKIITQNPDGSKVMQPKLLMNHQGQVRLASGKNIPINKPVTLNMAGSSNTLRMVNAGNLNLTHIGGKPVLLASKGNTLQNIQGQNVILQTQTNTSGPSLVLQQQGNLKVSTPSNQSNSLNIPQNFVLGTQMKINQPQVVFNAGMKTVSSSQSLVTQQGGHIVIGGQPVRLQTSSATSTQRLVLASQGQGGQIITQQILLPAGFQGTAINLKGLQGLKVIPIAQSQGKGIQGNRQVFARVMNPNLAKSQQSTGSIQIQDKLTEKTLPPPD